MLFFSTGLPPSFPHEQLFPLQEPALAAPSTLSRYCHECLNLHTFIKIVSVRWSACCGTNCSSTFSVRGRRRGKLRRPGSPARLRRQRTPFRMRRLRRLGGIDHLILLFGLTYSGFCKARGLRGCIQPSSVRALSAQESEMQTEAQWRLGDCKVRRGVCSRCLPCPWQESVAEAPPRRASDQPKRRGDFARAVSEQAVPGTPRIEIMPSLASGMILKELYVNISLHVRAHSAKHVPADCGRHEGGHTT